MPITTEVDTAAGVVVLRMIGSLSLSDMTAAFDGMLGNPEFQPGMGIVWDVRSGAIDALSVDEVQEIPAYVTRRFKMRGGGRLAIVVAKNLTYGVGRMVDGYADAIPIEREIFRDFDEAVRWASGSTPENGEGA